MILKKIDDTRALIYMLQGRLDSSNAAAVEAELLGALTDQGRHLVLDFSQLDYINSAGLRILVLAYQRLHPRGGGVVICGARDYIAEVFEIAGYNRLFSMENDLDQAMRTIAAPRDER